MKTQFIHRLLAALLGAALTTTLHAQLVADGGTLNFTGTTNLAGDLVVGTNGGNTLLTILAPGTVTNAIGTIGLNATSTNNQVRVENSGAVWQNNGDLYVGYSSSGNQLVVSNGATVANASGNIGVEANSSNNVVVVTGMGSLWSNNGDLYCSFGSRNQLVVSNGGVVVNAFGNIGLGPGGNRNAAVVTGTGSLWTNTIALSIGNGGSGNQLVVSSNGMVASSGGLQVGSGGSENQLLVSDGGMVANTTGTLGADPGSSNNVAEVVGANSRWTMSSTLTVGESGGGNQLVVSNGGTVQAVNATVGLNVSSINNRTTVAGGNLLVTGTLDIQRGTNVLNAGLISAGYLSLNNGSLGRFEFNGGTLITSGSTVNNGLPFVVGNGPPAATYQLSGNGLHNFNDGLIISALATLTGNGIVAGPLTVQSGGNLSPSAPLGLLVLNNSPVLQGTVLMQISKKGLNRTNNQIQVAAPLTYGGNLIVSGLGLNDLTVGDSFPIFSASSYGGAFTSVILPPLDPSLMWTNKLLIDGSIAVVQGPPPTISGVLQSGTNLVFNVSGGSAGGAYTLLTSTNVTLPLSAWATNSTGSFDVFGGITIIRGINPDEPQRYYNVRVP